MWKHFRHHRQCVLIDIRNLRSFFFLAFLSFLLSSLHFKRKVSLSFSINPGRTVSCLFLLFFFVVFAVRNINYIWLVRWRNAGSLWTMRDVCEIFARRWNNVGGWVFHIDIIAFGARLVSKVRYFFCFVFFFFHQIDIFGEKLIQFYKMNIAECVNEMENNAIAKNVFMFTIIPDNYQILLMQSSFLSGKKIRNWIFKMKYLNCIEILVNNLSTFWYLTVTIHIQYCHDQQFRMLIRVNV